MGFDAGFKKVAFVNKEAFIGSIVGAGARLIGRAAGSVLSPAARLAGKAAGGAGKLIWRGANKIFGGPLGTALTAGQAYGQFGDYRKQMNAAGYRG